VKPLVTVRKLDITDRITLPREIRGCWGIQLNDGLESAVDVDNIILSKYRPVCIFGVSANALTEIKDKNITKYALPLWNDKHVE